MKKLDPTYVHRLRAALNAANPNRVPLQCEAVLLERFIRALFFKPSTIRIITRSSGGSLWHSHAWVHQARRDRKNQKEIKAALERGETHYNGYPIGSPSEPCVYLCSREDAWELLREVSELATTPVDGLPCLRGLGELLGIPDNPYPDDESSIPPW